MDFEFRNPMFHMGTGLPWATRFRGGAFPAIRAARPARIPRRYRLQRDDSKRPPSQQLPPIDFTRAKRWLLLPTDLLPPDVARAFEFIPYGFKAALEIVRQSGSSPFLKSRFKLPKHLTAALEPIPFFTEKFSTDLHRVILTNQFVRYRFKRLIHRWRVGRLRRANTEDVVTMEPPKTPVSIYDWANRTTYAFEADTLFRGIRTSLLLCHDLFPDPKAPKNPFTNQPLTLGQLHFALRTLRSLGKSDWTTECFRACGYDIEVFRKRNNTQLRLSALNGLFNRPSEEGYVDLLVDFIEYCFSEAGLEVERIDVWEWAIRKKHDHSLIQAWRSICLSYYRGLITLPADIFKEAKDKILLESENLIRIPMTELIVLWRMR